MLGAFAVTKVKRIRTPSVELVVKQARQAGAMVDRVIVEQGRVTLVLASGESQTINGTSDDVERWFANHAG
jgi:hypothetical protein